MSFNRLHQLKRRNEAWSTVLAHRKTFCLLCLSCYTLKTCLRFLLFRPRWTVNQLPSVFEGYYADELSSASLFWLSKKISNGLRLFWQKQAGGICRSKCTSQNNKSNTPRRGAPPPPKLFRQAFRRRSHKYLAFLGDWGVERISETRQIMPTIIE